MGVGVWRGGVRGDGGFCLKSPTHPEPPFIGSQSLSSDQLLCTTHKHTHTHSMTNAPARAHMDMNTYTCMHKQLHTHTHTNTHTHDMKIAAECQPGSDWP